MLYFFYLLLGCYLCFLLLLVWAWLQLPTKQAPATSKFVKLSVLVAMRNEENNIGNLLQDLAAQSFPTDFLEILVIDDHSEDLSFEKVQKWTTALPSLRLLALPPSQTGKKQAIQLGVAAAQGELVVCTDGDCRVGKDWLLTMHNFYVATQAKFISGAVLLTLPPNFAQLIWLQKLLLHFQVIDFMSLVGTGAACLQLQRPTMCNGANLAYPKAVFQEVGGYAGNDHLASGDDEFLLQKIAKKYPQQVYFLKQTAALVHTPAHTRATLFFEQRKRWASKWKHHNSLTIKGLALFVFCFHTCSVGLLAWSLVASWQADEQTQANNQFVLAFWLLKIAGESLFFAVLLPFFKQQKLLPFVPFASLFYPFYSTVMGIAANQKGFWWKGRQF